MLLKNKYYLAFSWRQQQNEQPRKRERCAEQRKHWQWTISPLNLVRFIIIDRWNLLMMDPWWNGKWCENTFQQRQMSSSSLSFLFFGTEKRLSVLKFNSTFLLRLFFHLFSHNYPSTIILSCWECFWCIFCEFEIDKCKYIQFFIWYLISLPALNEWLYHITNSSALRFFNKRKNNFMLYFMQNITFIFDAAIDISPGNISLQLFLNLKLRQRLRLFIGECVFWSSLFILYIFYS